jgi:hypothetical protein
VSWRVAALLLACLALAGCADNSKSSDNDRFGGFYGGVTGGGVP